jgi:hypothetical protein
VANDDPKLDPTDDTTNTGGKSKSRRRPPPTLDLAANDVTPEMPADSVPADPPSEEAPVVDVEGTAASEPPPSPVHPTETPGAAPKAAKPVRQFGFVSGLAIALVSGLLGGAVALGVVSTFYSADQNIDSITELEARALDLRQRVDALESRAGTPVAGTLAPQELATRLDALETGLTELGSQVNQGEVATPTPDGTSAALDTRIGALEQKVAALPAPAAAATPDEVAAIGSRVNALEQRVSAIPAPAPAASPQDVATTNARVSALEQRLTEVSARQQTSGQGAAQLIALDALHDAIAEGRPFATELRASRALLGSGGDTLAALEPVAGEGFAGGPALAARLKAATAPAPVAAPSAGTSTGEQGVLDKLYESAKGLVSIRRSTQAPSDTEPGERATAEAALARRDYTAALAALNALPAAEKQAAAPIISSLEARQAALATVAGLSQHVLATFAGGAQ